MGMSDFYGERDEAESVATFHRALEIGSSTSSIPPICMGRFTNEQLSAKPCRASATMLCSADESSAFSAGDDPAFRGINGRPRIS
jgi:hypothetical protein